MESDTDGCLQMPSGPGPFQVTGAGGGVTTGIKKADSLWKPTLFSLEECQHRRKSQGKPERKEGVGQGTWNPSRKAATQWFPMTLAKGTKGNKVQM